MTAAQPPFATVAEWLAWQTSLSPVDMALGVARVAEVLSRMPASSSQALTLLIGGTNGKGSCVAYLAAMLSAGGYRVGSYTSPHLLRYHERIRIAGRDIGEAGLLAAFAAVERARRDVPLTYFEYGTLAALAAFEHAGCTARVLEVGLGGRLDAVNAVDADGALVVSVALDHQQWLGADRESIGREKAGIFRPGRPAVCADWDPPASLVAHARAIDARLLCLGRDFTGVADDHGGWCYRSLQTRLGALALPPLAGRIQLSNAAASLALLEACLGARCLPTFAAGLPHARLAGRFQRHVDAGVEWVLDVAHNPAAAEVLADTLATVTVSGRTRLVFGILDTKDSAGVIAALAASVDEWLLAPTDAPRAVPAATLAAQVTASAGADARISQWADVAQACAAARCRSRAGDRIVVAGSFHTVGPALAFLGLSS